MVKNQGFGTKAETLENLKNEGFLVAKLVYFSIRKWNQAQEGIISSLVNYFEGESSLVVRSSSQSEDSHEESMAGAFESILNVPKDRVSLFEAINQVITSYGTPSPEDQVLIQPMVKNVVMSGVVMTRCLDDGAPYYTINYDDESGLTDSVTSGNKVSKTVFVSREFRDDDFDSERIKKLVGVVKRLEISLKSERIDVEFAVDSQNQVYIFQARPIASAKNWKPIVDQDVHNSIGYLKSFIKDYFEPKDDMLGQTSLLGVMPDWNPAEIIGLTPRPLALSLYQHLITDNTWSRARAQMGYRAIPSDQLMLVLCGRPYIDVRTSFNSFLPSELNDVLGEKVINCWINYLKDHPEYHDKVEFEVIFSIHNFQFIEKINHLYPSEFTQDELVQLKDSYLKLTQKLVSIKENSSLSEALNRIENLKEKQNKFHSSHKKAYRIARDIRHTLAECKEFGTEPFAVIARHAFIAESLIRGLVDYAAISESRMDEFKNSLHTVSGEFGSDYKSVTNNSLSKNIFWNKYGHLRPGTYDILSPQYLEYGDVFFSSVKFDSKVTPTKLFQLSKEELGKINLCIVDAFLDISPADLFDYFSRAIVGREYSKFVFTKSVSQVLELLKIWGKEYSLSSDDVSWLKINDIFEILSNPLISDFKGYFMQKVTVNKKLCQTGHHLKLGHLIRTPSDLYVVAQQRNIPNFVTKRKVTAPVVVLKQRAKYRDDLEGKIICIENADPGFDWIFSQKIKGLITKFGGTNSHMTIRCSEFGLPAAIGCGEVLFEKLVRCSQLKIDCENKTLTPLEV